MRVPKFFLSLICFCGISEAGIFLDASESQEIHIALATNSDTYLETAGVGIYSILKNSNPLDFYQFYIFFTADLAKAGISDRQYRAFEQLRKEFDGRVDFEFIQIDIFNYLIILKSKNLRHETLQANSSNNLDHDG